MCMKLKVQLLCMWNWLHDVINMCLLRLVVLPLLNVESASIARQFNLAPFIFEVIGCDYLILVSMNVCTCVLSLLKLSKCLCLMSFVDLFSVMNGL